MEIAGGDSVATLYPTAISLIEIAVGDSVAKLSPTAISLMEIAVGDSVATLSPTAISLMEISVALISFRAFGRRYPPFCVQLKYIRF